jgi:hypothetical protein
MPCKITINTVAPAESSDKWINLTREGFTTWSNYVDWVTSLPGYLDMAGQWVTQNIEHQRTWIFNTRDAAEAFLSDREDNTDWQTIKASYSATNVTQTINLTDI